MLIKQQNVSAALIVSWAILLGLRSLSAAVYATAPGQPYVMGLHHQGWLGPICAWSALVAGLILAYRSQSQVS